VIAALQANWVEWLAVAFGILSVYLSVRLNILSWPTAIVNVLLYVIVFRSARLYADMGLQVVYAILSVYGWYEWLHGGENRTQLAVSRWTWKSAMVLVPIAALFAWRLGAWFAGHTDAALPYMDSSLTAASLVAQYLMTRKVLENWLIWIAADVVYVGMFIYKGLRPTAGLYAVFLVLAAMGYAQWRQSFRARHATRGDAVPAS
jgi:nicotinamide mononucleotide transporter